MSRLQILNVLDEDSFDSPPVFNSISRKKYFALPLVLQKAVAEMRSPTNKVAFVLMYGYFRASKRFFLRRYSSKDLDYVASKLGFDSGEIHISDLGEPTYRRHKKLILKHCGYRDFDVYARNIVIREIRAMVRSQSRPKLIFHELVDTLIRRKISLPTYKTLSTLIIEQMNYHKAQLVKEIDKKLTVKTRALLDELIEKDQTNASSKVKRYTLTLLKKFSYAVKPTKIKENIADLKVLRDLYFELEKLTGALDLTREGLQYFAQYVLKAQTWQLSVKSDEDRYLHMTAFVVHQYYRLQDLLIDMFLSSVTQCQNVAKREHKDQVYDNQAEKVRSWKGVATSARGSIMKLLSDMIAIICKRGMTAERKIDLLKELVTERLAGVKSFENRLSELEQESDRDLEQFDYYTILEGRSLKLQNRVSEIIKTVEFDTESSNQHIVRAIEYYRARDGSIDKRAPRAFLEPKMRKYLEDGNGRFRVSLYKVLLFIKIADAIKAGTLNLIGSYRYRSLEEYLIPHKEWAKSKNQILERAGLKTAANWEEVEVGLRKKLDLLYHKTNNKILLGENQYITMRKDGSFNLKKVPAEEFQTENISDFFPKNEYISILDVLSSVNDLTSFMSAFSKDTIKWNRSEPPSGYIIASLLKNNFDLSSKKMAQISKGIKESKLDQITNWYLTLDNLQRANDDILMFMDQLELPSIYVKDGKTIHTSSDGQKVGVTVDTVHSTYSFKYFGQGKGTSIYGYVDMRDFFSYTDVISSADREAAYVIDGLMHNDVVKSDIHSTDTHGYTEAIFGAMHLLGFVYAPRIKKLHKQKLYSFRNKKRRYYEDHDYEIVPHGYINTKLIADNWDEILRFIATIKLKETTASQLFKRLNSYSKEHVLYSALKEFGKIIKTTFALRYIDDLKFRQAIEKQLSKVENSNKFSNAVALGDQDFTQADREQHRIIVASRMLIKNAIVCWNYLYLSKKISEEKNLDRKREMIEAIQNGSVVAWRHINFHGLYDFTPESRMSPITFGDPKKFDLGEIPKWEEDIRVVH